MILLEILLIVLLIIYISIYKKKWVPKYPSFFSKGELVKIGHRGAPFLAHENTLVSFKKAIDAGVHGVEMDVQYSSDRQLVVYHDWDLDIIKGADKRIEKNSYAQIGKIRLKNKKINKIPLLIDVLDIIPQNCIKIIEIKSKHLLPTGIEKKILEIIKQYKILNSCIISSFNPFVIKRVKKLNPNIQTAYLWSKEDPQFIINSPLWVWFCKPDGFHADINYLEKKLMKWVRRKQMSILTFTVRTENQLLKAFDLGVDGVFIDDPNLN